MSTSYALSTLPGVKKNVVCLPKIVRTKICARAYLMFLTVYMKRLEKMFQCKHNIAIIHHENNALPLWYYNNSLNLIKPFTHLLKFKFFPKSRYNSTLTTDCNYCHKPGWNKRKLVVQTNNVVPECSQIAAIVVSSKFVKGESLSSSCNMVLEAQNK